jgi:uracil-DNA glycosylase family 4
MNKEEELAKIARRIARCRVCGQWGTGSPVPGEGNPDADIFFVGEAPGRVEAETGRPFVGRSGRLLRSMIEKIGLDEREVFITSPVQRLPLAGTPTKENILHSRTHLFSQISIIDPRVVVLLGGTACLALLDRKIAIASSHGTVVRKANRLYFITFHPAYALRFPEGKKEFVKDFRKLKRLFLTEMGNEGSAHAVRNERGISG